MGLISSIGKALAVPARIASLPSRVMRTACGERRDEIEDEPGFFDHAANAIEDAFKERDKD